MIPAVIVVTGTDTDVGKTVATAAIAACLQHAGRSVAAYKPTQTGVTGADPGDMDVVARLTGVPTSEGTRLIAPMAPRAAAAREAVALPDLEAHLAEVRRLTSAYDHVLVEGAGGLLVELTDGAQTLADLAVAVPHCGIVLVARSGLGTLNHVALTREALQRRGIRSLGVIIGSWPTSPDEIEIDNRAYLQDAPLLGVLPTGMPQLPPDAFKRAAVSALPFFA
ncbi:dethiobiotin synthase [Rudaeicoccus suwonensis]|uniref:ATP-dependent dethiobiotin synthetase BioD n=1 Tax=Rudaeicoccus suwonensis TaxID=657409 RepID=A0A561E964_9MICO|nr:dethiobiotin synthase [Rudaeicoccus suwonensis]TWE12146.1 dethiobiotin synthetase [Rudaeicoccus suwonensis]